MIDRIDLFALGVLAQCIATVTLSVALLVMYRRSAKLFHVLPLALAYNLIASLAAYRLSMRLVTDWYVAWIVLIAFTFGNIGLVIVMAQKWPRKERS